MGGVAFLYALWLPTLFPIPWGQGTWIADGVEGVSPLGQLWRPIREVIFGRRFPAGGPLAVATYALAGGLAALGLWPRRGQAWVRVAPIAMLAIAPPALAWGASLIRPVLVSRYILPFLPFMLVLIGCGVSRLPRAARVLAVGLLVVGQGWALARAWASPVRPDWRGLTEYMVAHRQAADGALADHYFYEISLAYYLKGQIPVAPNIASRQRLTRLWVVEHGPSRGVRERLSLRFPEARGPEFDGLEPLYIYDLRGVGPHYAAHD
jgi:hypothetical protein